MPELPEVETTRRGIAPHVTGYRITGVVVREPRLRWPVDPGIGIELPGATVQAVERRAKYLLLRTARGALIVHLGMSGSLCLVPAGTAAGRHAHVDLVFEHGLLLRYTDPRRFGSLHWTTGDPLAHPLLARLGLEPLAPACTGAALHARARGRRTAVKAWLMDSRIVVGVGNIYANEALFRAGIDPRRAAGRIGLPRYERLAAALRAVLSEAIAAGGTTLRDFLGGDGQPGYFRGHLNVYDRAGEPCPQCGTALTGLRMNQRASYLCRRCQR